MVTVELERVIVIVTQIANQVFFVESTIVLQPALSNRMMTAAITQGQENLRR